MKIQMDYEEKFIEKYGEISDSQTWGFSTSHARTRGENANANEWADVSNSTGFGGWLVPDPLTAGQKERVKAYFQANPNLTYQDPHWTNFFVQQVYKGGTSVGSNSAENVVAADGSTYTSSNMNHMTVGQNEVHINNFNSGDCSETNVLDNGADLSKHTGETFHTDKIMLMVDIDDTSCFGYHDSGSSNQDASPNHNDKAALVSAAVIDAWAEANGGIGEAVVDKWNRSFLGFDLAIKEGEQALDASTVKYNDGPEGYSYAKINNEVVAIDGDAEILVNGKPVQYATTNTNMFIAADKKTITDDDIQAEYRVDGDYKGKYFNWDYIISLLNEGWIPVKDKNLREWVKIGKSDGYFSDWIVTVTEATKVTTTDPEPDPVIPTTPSSANLRIIAEDLSVADIDADFDFNDVVFDVYYGDAGSAYVMVLAAGGTLPLYVNDVEVHGLLGYGTGIMINTGASTRFPGKGADGVEAKRIDLSFAVNSAADADGITVAVQKNGHRVPLTAQRAKAAAKMAVGTDYEWCIERQNIELKYSGFTNYVNNGNDSMWNTWYK